MPEVRRAEAGDDRALAALHRRVFPAYASTALGPGFCAALLRTYRRRSDGSVLVVAGPDGPVGYLVGAPAAVQREVNAALRVRAGIAALARVARADARAHLVGPEARDRIRRTLLRRRGAGPDPVVDGGIPGEVEADVRIVLIGVDEGARGSGVADALLEAFASDARARGHHAADLAVAAENVAAHRCYERNGWRAVASASEGDGPSHYRLDLDADPA